MSKTDLHIVDNASEARTVQDYLQKWCSIADQMDIATGYLEIGGLLELDGEWQKVDKIRILLGDEVTVRTAETIRKAVDRMIGRVRTSVDDEQRQNDFLVGVPAIVEALASRKIECRVYTKDKFHAKAYITHMRPGVHAAIPAAANVPEGYALVGSSNFTKAGLTKNVELNVQIGHDVNQLEDWFKTYWDQGEDITEAILRVVESRVREWKPYDVYLRSMYEYFKGRESSVAEWERDESKVFRGLAQYQKDGYHSLVDIADRYSGALLCDGVGLGKTYIGLMLLERFVVKERKNVVLMVPASARDAVWEAKIRKQIPAILEGFFPFKIVNHTDLLRQGCENLMDQIAEQAEVVIIDEAHHFRNRGSQRYRKLFDMMGRGPKKRLFMLTATPINNSFLDLQHMIELFTQRREDYFAEAPLSIHSLSGYFRRLEDDLNAIADQMETDCRSAEFLSGDPLAKALVVQRSRAYVKQSLSEAESGQVLFPERQPPTVAAYSLAKTYGALIDSFEKAFGRRDPETGAETPLLALPVYSPFEKEYYKGDPAKLVDLGMVVGRHVQIAKLLRTLFLKRFESSAPAFEETCVRVYARLAKFVRDYRERGRTSQIDRFLAMQADVEARVRDVLTQIAGDPDEFEDNLPDYIWDSEPGFAIDDFDIAAMIDDTLLDMECLAEFIRELKKIGPEQDDKLRELKRILLEDGNVAGKKVLVFSEFTSTARYIARELAKDPRFSGVFELDGQSKGDRVEVLRRFAPYYNDRTSATVEGDEIRILVATDVISEGLNLQDAACLVNYDLHWNPVRLMQRIGRIDRRRDAATEQKLLADHPELAADRGKAFFWNFLPPAELDRLLRLFEKVARKTLRISTVFGIEGGQLLTPDDDYEALRNFNSQYDGTPSAQEEMALEWQRLLAANPGYEARVADLPRKMFSGKAAEPDAPSRKTFFCYDLPVKLSDGRWTNGPGDDTPGECRWFLRDETTGAVDELVHGVWTAVRCDPGTPRVFSRSGKDFADTRKALEKHIRNSYMKKALAPIGHEPRLLTWMAIG